MTDNEYEIIVRGTVAGEVLEELDALRVEALPPQTVLRGRVRDQAALHGMLRRFESLGIELVEVRQLPPSRDHEA